MIAFSHDNEAWGNRRIELTANPYEVKIVSEGFRGVLGADSRDPEVGDTVRVSRLCYVTRISSETVNTAEANRSNENVDDYGSMLRFEIREV